MRPNAAKTVTVIANQTPSDVLQTILDVGDYDIVHIEPIERAYSRIRQTVPSVIILCLEDDQTAACQVLSMLKLDVTTAHIPVLTCVGPHENAHITDRVGEDSTQRAAQLIAAA